MSTVAFPNNFTVSQEFVDCMNAVGAYEYKFLYDPLTLEYRLIVLSTGAGVFQVVADTLEELEQSFIHVVRTRLNKPYSPRPGWCQDDGWGE